MVVSMYKKAFAILFFVATSAHSQSNCVRDNDGKAICAAPSGTAILAMEGVVCAPGRCVKNNIGYVKCSNTVSGAATTDLLGRVVCEGKCITPSKDYCSKNMNLDQTN